VDPIERDPAISGAVDPPGMHPSIADRLSRLAPDQRAAATAPDGPVLCVAPAGSGKTTTLVARVAWLVERGEEPVAVTVVAFNKRAAEELVARLDAALQPLGASASGEGGVRVRTFHALGREILAEHGVDVEALVDRDSMLRSLWPDMAATDRGRLDLAFSRLKLDLRVQIEDVAADDAAGPVARAWVAYERALHDEGALDFDDFVLRALLLLEADDAARTRWRTRCRQLLVDEAQDLDRTQLDLALLLAAPANRVFLVGDDDQTVYGWRLADVRRVLTLATALPGLRRVDLETNYRCPPPVVERAVRLVEQNRERFAKRIVAGPRNAGRLVLAPDATDDVVRVARAMASWPEDGSTRAVLARTNHELLVPVVIAVGRGLPFRAPDITLPIEDPRLDDLLGRAETSGVPQPLIALGRLRAECRTREAVASPGNPDEPTEADLVTALLGWAAAIRSLGELRGAVAAFRARLNDLRRDDALLTLATAHGTKGLEWDHVVVLADGFPGRRSISDAAEPERALEEERRLAYVAWTRARRSLTLLFDPAAPSRFLLEAFEAEELGIGATRHTA
jgi:DNA helicase-2/ATP-dependent DNA helicase PcrA